MECRSQYRHHRARRVLSATTPSPPDALKVLSGVVEQPTGLSDECDRFGHLGAPPASRPGSLAAGAISFASPCCIPLVPGYLAYLAGLVGADAAPTGSSGVATRHGSRVRVAVAALLFVLGFTVVFTTAVLGVLRLSDTLAANELLLQRIGGIVTIVMGLAFLGLIPALQRDVRIHHRPRGGFWGAPLLGGVFGLGWTPCLGPTLTGVIALASGTQVGPTAARGLLLVLAYCLGLGLPFILLAVGSTWAVNTAGCCAATPGSSSSPEGRCSFSSVRCSSPACGANLLPCSVTPSADSPHRSNVGQLSLTP